MWVISLVPWWGVQCHGGYHEYRGGGVILSTVGDVQYCGGYHDACGGIS